MSTESATASSRINALNERFAIPGIAQIVAGNGGLPKVRITAASAAAEIYLHGAQVTSWVPAGSQEVIFVSERSAWQDGRAIRGGVPICFPWFRAKSDDPKAPSHGFVRTREWRLESVSHQGHAIAIALATASDDATRKWWPHDFHIEHRITAGAELKLELVVTNTGEAPFRFEEALHTYHRVSDARAVRIAGLDGVAFLDNIEANREDLQHGDLAFTRQTDNAYLNTQHSIQVIDPGLGRQVTTAKRNSSTTVVWNPWQEGASSLADLGYDEWQQMACAEASNIRDAAVTLQPGQQHTMTATLSVSSER